MVTIDSFTTFLVQLNKPVLFLSFYIAYLCLRMDVHALALQLHFYLSHSSNLELKTLKIYLFFSVM